MIKKNNQTIDKIYKGSVEIAKIYKGLTLVYENYRDIVVSGNDVINITKAKANSLNYLKRFGKCEQNGTPTPDSPVDIICNNGTLKTRKSSGLPDEYQKVEYIESSGTQYIRTDIVPTDFFKMELKFYTKGGSSFYCAGARNPSSSVIYFAQSGATAGRKLSASANGTSIVANTNGVDWTRPTTGATYEIRLSTNGDGTFSYNLKDLTGNKEFLSENNEYPIMGTVTDKIFLFALHSQNIISGTNRCYYFKLYEENELIFYGIPCYRKSDNEAGLYDIVTNTFFTNAGTGAFTVGSDVADPVEVYVDGTPEVLTVCGKNIFDQSFFDTYVDRTITYKTFDIPNGTYTMSTNLEPINGTVANVFIGAGSTLTPSSGTNGVTSETPRTITVTNGKYIVGYRSKNGNTDTGHNPKDFNWQLELGSTATTYDLYSAQTASVENLLAVGNYKDEQDIISGAVTRNVGIMVLTGNEDWVLSTSKPKRFYLALPSNTYKKEDFTPICTHFKGHTGTTSTSSLSSNELSFYYNYPSVNTIQELYVYANIEVSTANDFKQWLNQQYTNGTPVIIVYPLATSTTETATAQPVNIQKGANTIQVTQASINDLELEIKYKGK